MLPILLLATFSQDLPTLEVRHTKERPAIDGKLSDKAWQSAQAVDFKFPWDIQTGAKQPTVARLLYDDTHLYIGYDCTDSDITAQYKLRDDPTYKDDAVEAFINPRPSQAGIYFGFEMNSDAVMFDYVMFFGKGNFKRFDIKGFQMATAKTPKGWSLELAIPFSEFEPLSNGKTPNPGDQWTINLNRWDGTEPNRRLSQWSPSGLEKPNPHYPKRFGKMVFGKP